jgi:FAD binding domain
MPEAVVFPGSAAEVAAIVCLAHEHRFPVVPWGAGTGRSGGSVPRQRDDKNIILPVTRGFGSKNTNFGVFSLGQEGSKTVFRLQCPSLRHNFGL